ncbi:MAG TPA: pseudouridine synthase [Frankiaceae bacterium]|nr:pseudouridine synthase [Frankiaceae bacterium]
MDEQQGIRLQKALASSGIGSRRACEELIVAGRVAVNGRVVRELGTRIDLASDEVAVDGVPVPVTPDLVYLAMNKPRGVLTTMADDQGRACVGDYVTDRPDRVFHVGRLDADSEGLLLLTNDGALAHRLTHPSFAVPKTYLVQIDGRANRRLPQQLRSGVELEDGPARADAARIVAATDAAAQLEVVIHDGRNRVIRRMFDALGHPVRRLVRTSIGPLVVGELRPGRVRHLSAPEVRSLYKATAGVNDRPPRR